MNDTLDTIPQASVIPVPPDAPTVPTAFGKLGKPVAIYTYHDEHGNVVTHRLRFEDAEGNKTIRPLSCCVSETGEYSWEIRAIPAPRHLYKLPTLVARPDARVLVVEGEKTADRAADIFPDCVVTTSSGGAQAARKADWSPLKGREVNVWGDNDAASRGFRRCRTSGCPGWLTLCSSQKRLLRH